MSTWTLPGAAGRSDPGRTDGSTAGYAPVPRCGCRHLGTVHVVNDRKTHGRGSCNAADPNPCPCKELTPEVLDAD